MLNGAYFIVMLSVVILSVVMLSKAVFIVELSDIILILLMLRFAFFIVILCVVMLSLRMRSKETFYGYAECRHAECQGAIYSPL